MSIEREIQVLIVGASDFALACRPRALSVKVAVPDRLYIGERGATEVTLAAGGFRRTVRLAAIAEQRGDLDPPEVYAGEIAPGAETRIHLPIVPRRRGRVFVDRIWLRWKSPLALVEFVRQVAVDRSIDGGTAHGVGRTPGTADAHVKMDPVLALLRLGDALKVDARTVPVGVTDGAGGVPEGAGH